MTDGFQRLVSVPKFSDLTTVGIRRSLVVSIGALLPKGTRATRGFMANELPVSREHLSHLAHETEVAVNLLRQLIQREGPIEALDEPLEKLVFVSNRLNDLAHPRPDLSTARPPHPVTNLPRR